MTEKNILEVIRILKKTYPTTKIALKFRNHWQLLVATILSAQCTDKQVNIITKNLFKKYLLIKDYAKADLKEFELDIKSAGFYRNKAKNIINTAKIITKTKAGTVPKTMEELLELPGVARKTANIVLYNAFKKNEGIAVDTHVRRISKLLGLTENHNPDKIERDLIGIVPRHYWGQLNHLLVFHGRRFCIANRPKCLLCPLKKLCFYGKLKLKD